MQVNICEIFHSIQGESTCAGLPCIFIRLSGCNLNCAWCDTPYAQTESHTMTFHDIFRTIEAMDCRLVEITGGEPLLQPATPALIDALIQKEYKVLLETNGSKNICHIHPDCTRIVDIKCPSSKEESSFLMDNIPCLTPEDEIKFVIADRNDYEFAGRMIHEKLNHISPGKIHLSPVWGCLSPEAIAGWMIEDGLQARLSLQQHKIIWDPEKRGV